jgi:Hg(II)-responsive transcriptional regulator
LNSNTYKIGKTAELAGVNRETVRYYERIKLISPPARRRSGYREFSQIHIEQIRFIKRAQELGFTLKEIRELLDLKVDATTDCSAVRAHAEKKRRAVTKKIETLVEIRNALDELIARCKAENADESCAILKALTGDNKSDE